MITIHEQLHVIAVTGATPTVCLFVAFSRTPTVLPTQVFRIETGAQITQCAACDSAMIEDSY